MNKKCLFIFDMDHTILEENSDYEIRKLLPKEAIHEVTCKNEISWLITMQKIFDKMKEYNISVDEIKSIIQKLELTKGMKELFNYLSLLKQEFPKSIEVIIISGANMKFVEWVIETHDLSNLVDSFYSFNCDIKDEKLILSPHHSHDCSSCDPYLCKRHIIENKINLTQFDKLVFFGDGSNDYCACLALNKVKDSVVYFREGYALDLILNKSNSNQQRMKLQSELVMWKDGFDILSHLKQIKFK